MPANRESCTTRSYVTSPSLPHQPLRVGTARDMSQIDRLQQLLNQCAQGDDDAFAELYRLMAPKLFPLSIRMLKRRDWAEEALQESFVKIWQGAGRYDPGRGSVMTWMTSIVRYRCLDMLRHERLQPALEDTQDYESDTNPGSEPMQATLLSSETQALLRCMDKLDVRQRRSILLAYYGGYTHREIAHRMGAPVGTVKSWIRRSLERIKECLGI